MAFPPDPLPHTRLLCGLGVPDVRQSLGDWFVYTTDEAESTQGPPEGLATETAGFLFRVGERGGRISTTLPGPVNVWKVEKERSRLQRLRGELEAAEGPESRGDLERRIAEAEARLREARRERVSLPLEIVLEQPSRAVSLTLGGRTQRLRPGEWSGFFRVKFALNPLLRLSALVRAKVLEWTGKRFRLYVEPINFDPADVPPHIPISAPRSYSRELASALGPFETAGWACATSPLKDGALDDATFLEDVEFVLGERERMLERELGRRDWRLLYFVFSEQDRLQHLLFHHLDAAHPLHRPERAAATLRAFGRDFRAAEAIREGYREMDRIVGKVLAAADPGTVVLVVSD